MHHKRNRKPAMSTPFYDLASLVVVPSGYKSGKIYAQKPLTTDGQLTFTRASTATRVNASGALETVSSGVPRLDYTNSSCPKILLEPQRTQKLTYNNDFSNAAWNKTYQGLGSAPVLTANYGTDPFGGNNAWRIQLNLNGGTDSSSRSWMLQSFNPSATVTLSIYIKLNTAGTKTFVLSDSGGDTVTVNSTSWTRITQVENGGAGEFRFGLIGGSCSDTLDASICYFQSEEGSYATSIINSTSAAVTRLGERPQKTGIGSLIGGTSGTVFFEIKTNKTLSGASYKQFFYYENAAASQAYMYLASTNYIVTNPTLGNITSSIALQPDTTYKVAIAYASNDFKLYINGVERGSSTSGTPIDAVNIISIGSYQGSSEFNEMTFAQYLHFKSRLTNAQLAELTTL